MKSRSYNVQFKMTYLFIYFCRRYIGKFKKKTKKTCIGFKKMHMSVLTLGIKQAKIVKKILKGCTLFLKTGVKLWKGDRRACLSHSNNL